MPSTVAMAMERAQVHFKSQAKVRAYRKNPAQWAKDKLGVTFWSKQRDIANSIVDHTKVAVKSGHGIGKSYLAAILVLWWIDCHRNEDCLVITTAPTSLAVTGIVWEYIRKMHREANKKLPDIERFIGSISEKAEWKNDLRDIVAFGVKPADSNNAGFTGRHYKYTLVLIDEACGVAENLFTSAEAVTVTDGCHILAIGNPVDPNTPFGNIFLGNGGKGLSDWDKHTISALDNPNFTGEDVPLETRAGLTSVAKVNGWREKWGTDSNEWKIRVTGEFPASSESKMFPLHLLYKGMETVCVPMEYTSPVLGVDVARFGSDSTTVIRYHDGDTSIEGKWQHHDSIQSARRIHDIAVRLNATQVRVDGVGVGAGVVDQLRVLSLNYDYTVWEMQGAGMSPDNKKYLNARAWWHQNVYDMIYEGRLHLPDTTNNEHATQLFEEMREIEKKYNATYGSLQIESKDDMRRRGVASPDFSDALMYACAPLPSDDDPMAPYGPGDTVTYDPFAEYESTGYVISPI